VVRWDEVQRRERAVRRPAERFALWRLSVTTFVRLIRGARFVSVFFGRREREGGRDRHTHPTALDVRQSARKVNAGPISEQCANDKRAICHAQIGITRPRNRRKSARTAESMSGSSPYKGKWRNRRKGSAYAPSIGVLARANQTRERGAV